MADKNRKTSLVARPKKDDGHNRRVDLRASDRWMDRVSEAAGRKQLAVSAYIRMVVSERMDQDGITDGNKMPKKITY